jgi:hypothetical protein
MTCTNGNGIDSGGQTQYVLWSVMVHVGAVTQFTFGIVPPTLDAASGGKRTGEASTRNHISYARLQISHLSGRWSISGGTVAQFP